MKRMHSVAILMALAGMGSVQASGMVTVVGTLTGITKEAFQIETKNSVYTVKKKSVTPGQAEQLDRSQDNEVALTVPFEGFGQIPTSKPSVSPVDNAENHDSPA